MTEPNEPALSDQEIEEKRNDAPREQAPVVPGIGPVSQDPDLFPLDGEED